MIAECSVSKNFTTRNNQFLSTMQADPFKTHKYLEKTEINRAKSTILIEMTLDEQNMCDL